ncbi:MAG TPA: hypothetical protein P5547_12955 [Spirochaetota bacterium]|nr:hypothetical protein [Spirochaetota bacterium]HRR61833.1 hypothetical protein [Spirochaetota bacterium]
MSMISKQITIVCGSLIIVSMTVCSWAQDKNRVTFLYTNSLNGIIDACQCAADPKGGLVKRGYAVAQLKTKYPGAVLLESGDFCSYYPDTMLTKYIMKAYRHIGYTAVGIGDQEFAAGVNTFHQYINELPFVSANLYYSIGGRWLSPKKNITVTVGTMKIGITAIIDNDAFKYYPNDIITKIKVTDITEALKKEIAAMEKMDFIVLLSHCGFEKDKELAAQFPQIGLIVGGHSQTLIKKPVKIGNTFIVQAGANGARIGVLDAVITNKYIASYKHTFIHPRYEDPDDEAIAKMIKEYNDEIGKQFPR